MVLSRQWTKSVVSNTRPDAVWASRALDPAAYQAAATGPDAGSARASLIVVPAMRFHAWVVCGVVCPDAGYASRQLAAMTPMRATSIRKSTLCIPKTHLRVSILPHPGGASFWKVLIPGKLLNNFSRIPAFPCTRSAILVVIRVERT